MVKYPSLQAIREAERRGLVTVRARDDLVIANYTHKCQYARAWNETTTRCRGLILRVDRPWPDSTRVTELVALPWPKFFNYGEQYPTSQLIEVSEKLDGSLGILYRHRGSYQVASRGSFDSEHAQWATDFLNHHHDLSDLPQNWTLLFEIVAPQFRVVVDYGQTEALYLIGVRDRFSGKDYTFAEVQPIAQAYGFPTPSVYPWRDIPDLLARAKALPADFEGWVLRFADGTRLKVKGDAYRALARVVQGINPRRVLEALAAGQYQEYLETVPEEFQADVRSWANGWLREVSNLLTLLGDVHRQAPKATRKDYALYVQANQPEHMAELMMLYDGKDPTQFLYKRLLQTTEG